jgi:aquaporin Z
MRLVDKGKNTGVTSYVTELIGTFFLVLTIGLMAATQSPLAPLAIGGMLTGLVYMGRHVSGAHYNPAITLAIFFRGKLAPSEVMPYVLSQVLGALLASATVYLATGSTFAPVPAEGYGVLAVLLVEVLFTFALALVILNVATVDSVSDNSYYGLAIGLTVTAGAFAAGPISGGVLNPAVGMGPILLNVVLNAGSASALWFYLVGPTVGATVAVLVFNVQHGSE